MKPHIRKIGGRWRVTNRWVLSSYAELCLLCGADDYCRSQNNA